ncbi:MAG: hypothetical protein ACK5HL_00985 [Bacilli bacterium]
MENYIFIIFGVISTRIMISVISFYRIKYLNSKKYLTLFLIAFIEGLCWLIFTKTIINTEDVTLILSFILGYMLGNYLGIWLLDIFSKNLYCIRIFINQKNNNLIKKIYDVGFKCVVIESNGFFSKNYLVIVYTSSKNYQILKAIIDEDIKQDNDTVFISTTSVISYDNIVSL